MTQRRRGNATVLALMVSLLLMILVSGTMALTIADTEMTQDYTRNRTSFQAADSGVQHGRAQLNNALTNFNLPASTTPTNMANYRTDHTSGITTNNKDIALIRDTGGNVQQVLPRGSTVTTNGWSGGTNAPSGSYGVAYSILPNGVTAPVAGDISQTQTFHYNYEITSRGAADIEGQSNVSTRRESGNFDVKVERPSFATYGYFTESLKNQNDEQLWFYEGETYDGPTHVNAAPPTGQAAFWGNTTFKGKFTAVQEAYEDSIFGGTPNPDFQAGAEWGVDQVQTPQNGWSQLRASIGDLANIETQTAPSNAQLRGALGMTVDSTAVPPGVYYSSNSNSGNSLLGGLFVNGTAQNIAFSRSGSEQVIAITMTNASGPWAGTHTWTVHDNPAANTSYVKLDGVVQKTFNKAFNGVIHVEGAVNGLAGDGNATNGDIQKDAEITVSATGDIKVKDHITYQEDPRTTPATKNILGIYSSGGNVMLAQNAPSNLNLHATVMAASTNHGVGAEGITVGSSYDYTYPNKGNWNLLGGLIENKNQTTGVFYSDGTLTGYRWNFAYDDRFTEGAAPPYFPYVSKFTVTMMGVEHTKWGRKYY